MFMYGGARMRAGQAYAREEEQGVGKRGGAERPSRQPLRFAVGLTYYFLSPFENIASTRAAESSTRFAAASARLAAASARLAAASARLAEALAC